MIKEKSVIKIKKEILEDYYWETNSPRHHPISEHNLDIQSVFDNAFLEGREQGFIRATNIDLGIIDEWAEEVCIDKREKCHECVNKLKERISGTKDIDVATSVGEKDG